MTIRHAPYFSLTGLATLLMSLLIAIPTAFAQDQDETAKLIADTLIATMSKVSGDTFSYEDLAYDVGSNTVILNEVSLVRKGAKGPAVTIATTRIENANMMAGGGFSADDIVTTDIKLFSRTVPGTIESASATNIVVKSADAVSEGAITQWFSYETSNISAMRLGAPTNGPIAISNINTIADIDDDGIPVAGTVAIENMTIDIDRLPDHPAKQQLSDLGYEQLTIALNASGRYDVSGETLHVDRFVLDAEEAAKLSVEASIGGIPARFMASPLDVRTIIATASIGKLTLSVDDQSLTERILSYQAEKSGTTPEALAAQLTGGLGFLLTALQNEAFQTQASQAIGTFLTEPDRLTITMTPDSPVPFLQVFAAATSTPGTIVDLLGLAISNAP